MDSHRVRSAKSVDNNPDPFLFVEIEKDSWIEVSKLPTHKQIEAHVSECKKTNQGIIGYATRAFRIGIIKDWIELSPIIK